MSNKFTLEDVNPLNEGHLKNINDSLDLIDKALLQAELAERAGVPQKENIKILDDYQKKFQALKQVYFPGR